MGLVLGIIAAVCTVLYVLVIAYANGMSDAPSQSGLSILPGLIIGSLISGVLILTHYVHISW